VTLPLPVWDEYAREARITGRSITECLVSAIKRDYERKKGTLEPMETLDQNVRAFHAAASQLLQETREVLERVGPLQGIGMRLSRLEGALGARLSDSPPLLRRARSARRLPMRPCASVANKTRMGHSHRVNPAPR
jgi:hypothetical protein